MEDLGFTDSANADEIYRRAAELGLDLCPPEVGPYLELSDKDQPNNTQYYVAMKGIADSRGDLRIFKLGRNIDGVWFDNDTIDPMNAWSSRQEFIFRIHES